MARILYGVMGNTNGHIMRTLSLLAHLPQHQFHLVGGGRVPEVVGDRYPVLRVPVLHTRHKHRRLDLPGTVAQIALRLAQIPSICGRIHQLVRAWKPDLLIADREFFTPIYARLTGRFCLSVDHTHILKSAEYPVPPELRFIHRLTLLNDYLLYDWTRHNLISSFFLPPRRQRRGITDEFFSGVVRPELNQFTPSDRGHILVYLSIPQFPELIECLRQTGRPVLCYGAKRTGSEGPITYRAYDERTILEDLASCSYAVINGGHNLICEALHFHKPVLCFPIAGLVEQYINVHFIRELHYGDYSYDHAPGLDLFQRFEEQLPRFRQAIAQGYRDGTAALASRIDEIAQQAASPLSRG
ncbi:MAG: glycosyltransferase family protein [Verrucomicrobiia bacterium]